MLRQRVCPGVAVQDSDHARRPRLRDQCASVVFRLSRVNNDWPVQLRGKRYLRSEGRTLGGPRRIVVVVVEAALAYRNGIGEKLTQPENVALRVEAGRVVGMYSGSRKDKAGILARVFSRESRRLERLSDADDSRRARVAGARDYRVAVAGERRVGEVGMAVDEA